MSARTAFGVGTAVGTAGGMIGLGGAEFRLPALVGVLGFGPRQAVVVNLIASLAVLTAALPVRAVAVPLAAMAPYLPAMLGMLAGAIGAAWVGAGWLRQVPEVWLARLMLVLLTALGLVLMAQGALVGVPTARVGDSLAAQIGVAALCGVGIGLVSSLLGVAGGELIIPAFVLLFGVDVKVAGSMAMLIGIPTIAVGLLRHARAGSLPLDPVAWRCVLGPLVAGSILGALVGAAMLGFVPARALKIGLGAILIWSAWRVFHHLPGGS